MLHQLLTIFTANVIHLCAETVTQHYVGSLHRVSFNLSESPSDLYICSLGPFQILPLMLLRTIFAMTLPLK